MAIYSFLCHVVWLAGIALTASFLAAGVLAASPALLPAVPLQAATFAVANSAVSVSPAVDSGTIAYVQMSTQDIHTISPDGTGDRVVWTNPGLERDEKRD